MGHVSKFAFVILGVALAVALPLAAQTKNAATVAHPLTVEDVIKMSKASLSEDIIIQQLKKKNQTFDLSTEQLVQLKTASVSDHVISVMMDPSAASTMAASEHPAAAAAGASVSPVVSTNINDPSASHEAGIYMYANTGRDGVQLIMLEPSVYSQGKSSGVFTSAMTYGIAKVKWKAVVRGAHSNSKSSDAKMVFYFYFEETGAGLSHASSGTSTPNEYTLLKFDVKGDSRETVVMKMNAFGSSSGTDDKSSIPFTFTKLKPGVYKVVTKNALEPGEYCFLSAPSAGSFGAGAAGANRLFDFSVLPPD